MLRRSLNVLLKVGSKMPANFISEKPGRVQIRVFKLGGLRCMSARPLTENTQAYNILAMRPEYRSCMVPEIQQPIKGELGPLPYESVQILVNSSSSSPDDIANAVSSFRGQCKKLSLDHICTLLQAVEPVVDMPNVSLLLEELDDECCNRISEWQASEMLLVADHWFRLQKCNKCVFTRKMVSRLSRRPTSLSAQNLVQLLFYINVHRKVNAHVNMYEFEYALEKVADQLTLEELSVAAMGFFKTQTPIRSDAFLRKVVHRVSEEADSIRDMPLSAILKMLRNSNNLRLTDNFIELLDILCPRLNRFNNMACLQIALLATSVQVFHKDVMDAVSCKFLDNLPSLRLKDLERLAFMLTFYNYTPPGGRDALKLIEEELRCPERQEEINSYPKSFATCINYLLSHNKYPQDLLERVTSAQFINKYDQQRVKLGREAAVIDSCLDVEWPSFPARCLKPKQRKTLLILGMLSVPVKAPVHKMSHTGHLLWKVKNAVDQLFNTCSTKDFAKICYTLPHFSLPDLVFCLDSSGTPCVLPEEFLKIKRPDIKYPVPGAGSWHCFMVNSRSMYTRNTKELVGQAYMKARQLNHIGYKVTQIPWFDVMDKNTEDVVEYMKMLIPEFKAP